MLDRTNNERVCVAFPELDWLGLTRMERRFIRLYRLLGEREQRQLHRLSEVLATTSEEPAAS